MIALGQKALQKAFSSFSSKRNSFLHGCMHTFWFRKQPSFDNLAEMFSYTSHTKLSRIFEYRSGLKVTKFCNRTIFSTRNLCRIYRTKIKPKFEIRKNYEVNVWTCTFGPQFIPISCFIPRQNPLSQTWSYYIYLIRQLLCVRYSVRLIRQLIWFP